MSRDRRAARRLALEILYQAEIRDQLPSEALSSQRTQEWSLGETDPETTGSEPAGDVISYATALLEGVEQHSASIDERISRHADRWALARMPVIDRNLLRLAIFELIWMPDVPVAVVINEAIELAKSLSTEESGRFINGLLGRIVEVERAPPV